MISKFFKNLFKSPYEFTPDTCPKHEHEYLGCDVGHLCKHCGINVVELALSKGKPWTQYND